MKIQTLNRIRDKVQQLFSENENVSVQIRNWPYENGDLGVFTLQTECLYTREGRACVDDYVGRVELCLNELGYEVKKKVSDCIVGGPIAEIILAFRPKQEHDVE